MVSASEAESSAGLSALQIRAQAGIFLTLQSGERVCGMKTQTITLGRKVESLTADCDYFVWQVDCVFTEWGELRQFVEAPKTGTAFFEQKISVILQVVQSLRSWLDSDETCANAVECCVVDMYDGIGRLRQPDHTFEIPLALHECNSRPSLRISLNVHRRLYGRLWPMWEYTQKAIDPLHNELQVTTLVGVVVSSAVGGPYI